MNKTYFVYIIKSEIDHSLYTGQTNNLKERLNRHNKGYIKSTKLKIPYELCYYEEFQTRVEAMKREWEFKKKWNTERKKKLIGTFNKLKIEKLLGQ